MAFEGCHLPVQHFFPELVNYIFNTRMGYKKILNGIVTNGLARELPYPLNKLAQMLNFFKKIGRVGNQKEVELNVKLEQVKAVDRLVLNAVTRLVQRHLIFNNGVKKSLQRIL